MMRNRNKPKSRPITNMADILEIQQRKEPIKATDHGKICLGMDFGTTYSCAAVFNGAECIAIPTPEGGMVFPTVVAYEKSGRAIFGTEAQKSSCNVIKGVKRVLGTEFDSDQFEKERKFHPELEFERDPVNGSVLIKVMIMDSNNRLGPDKELLKKPQEIISDILRYMKEYAELWVNRDKQMLDYYGGTNVHGKKLQGSTSKQHLNIEDCVITVPVKFTIIHRRLITDAANMAGFKTVHCIVHEPIAAALCHTNCESCDKSIGIYDLGGGTFDFSIVKVNGNKYEVLTSHGDHRLGGLDFTQTMADEMIAKYKREHGYNNTTIYSSSSTSATMLRDFESTLTPQKRQELHDICELAKIKISIDENHSIYVPNFDKGNHLEYSISRDEFEQMIEHYIDSTMTLINDAINEAYSRGNNFDLEEIILIGGSTKMPIVKKTLQTDFNAMTINSSYNPQTTVAIGAAKLGAVLVCGSNIKFMGKIQKPPVISGTLNASIGIELEYGNMQYVLDRGTLIPQSKVYRYTIDSSGRENVKIKVYEGQRLQAKFCQLIGDCTIKLEKGAKPLETYIDIKFDVDQSGNLNLTATLERENKQHMGFAKDSNKSEDLKIIRKPDVVREMRNPSQEELQQDELLRCRLSVIDANRQQISSALTMIQQNKNYFYRMVPKETLVAFENNANELKIFMHKNWDNMIVTMEEIGEKMTSMNRSWEEIKKIAGIRETAYAQEAYRKDSTISSTNDECAKNSQKDEEGSVSATSAANVAQANPVSLNIPSAEEKLMKCNEVQDVTPESNPSANMSESLVEISNEEYQADEILEAHIDTIHVYQDQLSSLLVKAQQVRSSALLPAATLSTFEKSVKDTKRFLLFEGMNESMETIAERVGLIERSWEYIEMQFTNKQSKMSTGPNVEKEKSPSKIVVAETTIAVEETTIAVEEIPIVVDEHPTPIVVEESPTPIVVDEPSTPVRSRHSSVSSAHSTDFTLVEKEDIEGNKAE